MRVFLGGSGVGVLSSMTFVGFSQVVVVSLPWNQDHCCCVTHTQCVEDSATSTCMHNVLAGGSDTGYSPAPLERPRNTAQSCCCTERLLWLPARGCHHKRSLLHSGRRTEKYTKNANGIFTNAGDSQLPLRASPSSKCIVQLPHASCISSAISTNSPLPASFVARLGKGGRRNDHQVSLFFG